MSTITAKSPAQVKDLSNALTQLKKNPGWPNVLQVVGALTSLLGVNDAPAKLFNVAKMKINAHLFMEAEGFADRRACYKVADGNDRNIDFKLYWVQKAAKRVIAIAGAFTPNFEDEPFYQAENIGIDVVVPKEADRIIIVLSNNYVIRTLELCGLVTPTQHDILTKWGQPFDFSNKAQVHQTLWQSFDLYPINKQFYRVISSFFTELVQHLEKHNILDKKHRSQFTSRLIGRIIFCWFLKKKEIIPLDSKYFDAQGKTASEYYRESLEKLFFKILNTPIENRVMMEDGNIPFLNGGLFEQKESDLPGKDILSFPNDYFQRFYAFLNQYNFTTDESTSTFQQVAIDPEMLGRIFENLLAEEIEETGEQARKAKGTFYTPREIVDYMCRESLKAYLDEKLGDERNKEKILHLLLYKREHDFDQRNDRADLAPYKSKLLDALDNLRAIDPACGSGAFPIGILQIMLSTYDRIESRLDHFKTKSGIIERNLYGVDIEPMAVEIARLRTWLSLIVDVVVNPKEKNLGIDALPNLDFKFVCANSLISLERGGQIEIHDDPELEQKMQDIRDRYFKTNSLRIKDNMKKEFEKLLQKSQSLFTSVKQKQLLTYHPFNADNITHFFDPKFMFGVEKFDVVIANPPYIKEYVYRNAFDGLRSSPYYQGKMDIWYLFACKGIDWLREKGILTFIAQNNWVTSYGASKMRNKVMKDTRILNMIDFGDFKIFETAGIQTMIMMFKKDTSEGSYSFDFRRLQGDNLELSDVFSILSKSDNCKAEYLNPQINRENLIDKKLTFSNPGIGSVLEKILLKTNFRLNEKEVANGIHHHHDKVNNERKEILNGQYKVGDGIFVLSNEEKKQIKFTKRELELIKPSYTTKELYRWYGNSANQEWVIYTDSSFKDKTKIEEYPNIKKHLDQFKKVITSDNKPYGLHRARAERFFKGEKIIAVRKCARPTFTYIDFDCYVSATFYVIKTERINQKYLTGLLNSSLIAFWLKHKGKMQGNNYQVDKEPIIDLPIIKASQAEEKIIADAITQIIETIRSEGYAGTPEKQTKIKEYERQIDQMVYELYDLTKEEIEIVEKSFKSDQEILDV